MTPRSKGDIDYSGESRHDKFRRLAQPRVEKVLNDLRVLGNLASKSRYEYTQEEVDRMFESIDARLQEVKTKFGRKQAEEKESFEFGQAPDPAHE